MENDIVIRDCRALSELAECVDLQREVFQLPEVEISPVRHLVVTINAGGFVLGAFDRDELIGFVLSVPAFLRGEKAFYSHMTAVRQSFQGAGVGRMLKWAQRDRSLEQGVRFIKWTFEPWKARNAFFNLEKLGAIVTEIQPNFYGVDYASASSGGKPFGLASDRLFAEWHLESPKVTALAAGDRFAETALPEAEIWVTPNWTSLVGEDPARALAEQERLRTDFEAGFSRGLIARGFRRDDSRPKYLLYKPTDV